MSRQKKRTKSSHNTAAQRSRPTQPAASQPIQQVGEMSPAGARQASLKQACRQWQLGDWEGLARLASLNFEHGPDRAQLALLAATACLEAGDAAAARRFTELAQAWGIEKKLFGQVLLVGLLNTYGRVAAACGQDARASAYFAEASSLARLCLTALLPRDSADAVHGPLAITQIACHTLGDAWAGNTVNTVIFRHHAVLSWGNFQFCAFYVDAGNLRIMRRDLAEDAIDVFDLPGEYKLQDAHNSISLGCDRAGYIHMAYDHHGSRLRYRRSAKPLDIQAWGEEANMTGTHEDKVTYPCFILPSGNQPLLLMYRDGIWNKGTTRVKVYHEATERWVDRPTAILSGAEQRPWTCNAYLNHPANGSDGSLHLSFVWRTDSLGSEQRINNINVGYARSTDRGVSWHTSNGRPCKLPLTPVNAETVHPVSPGSNLINQTSMAVDSHNRPHIVFYSNDPDGIPQYQHLWFDGKAWRHQFISQRQAGFDLMGAGTLQIPISRPEIVVDWQDHVYVIYRADFSGNKMAVLRLLAPDYRYDPEQTAVIWEEDLGYAEPIIDRTRWQQSNILTLLFQHNRQPQGDHGCALLDMPVTLVDLQFD